MQKNDVSDFTFRKSDSILLLAVFLFSVLIYLVGFFVNESTTFATTNGLWKMLFISSWGSGAGEPISSNLLFGAVAAVLYHISSDWGVTPTRALAFFNLVSVAASAAILSIVIRRATKSIPVAVAGSVGFATSGGALTHALGSEDIAGVLPLISGLLLIFVHLRPFSGPNPNGLIGVGILTALIHLWEWRAALPIYVAIALLGSIHLRRWGFSLTTRSVAFLLGPWFATMIVCYTFIIAVFQLNPLGTSLLTSQWSPALFFGTFLVLIFPGKGVGSIWGGFAEEKFGFLAIGFIESIVGGRNLMTLSFDYSPGWFIATVSVSILAIYGFTSLWRKGLFRESLSFVGFTILAATLLNFYSQPQDPQMHVTQLAFMFFLAGAGISSLGSKLGPRVSALLAICSVILFSIVSTFSFQGPARFWTNPPPSDSEQLGDARATSALLSSNSILIGNGWENQVTWLAFELGGLDFLANEDSRRKDAQGALFAFDVIASDPLGTPEEWTCSVKNIVEGVGATEFIRVDQSSSWSFNVFRTVVDIEKATTLERLWDSAFEPISDQRYELNQAFLANLCG